MNDILKSTPYKISDSRIIKQLADSLQVINYILHVINCFIFILKLRIVFTYIDVFILTPKGGTRRGHINNHLVNIYKLLKTRLDAVNKKCSQSLQREPRNIVRDKDYPSSAAQEIPSHLLIHRFDLDVKLEVA